MPMCELACLTALQLLLLCVPRVCLHAAPLLRSRRSKAPSTAEPPDPGNGTCTHAAPVHDTIADAATNQLRKRSTKRHQCCQTAHDDAATPAQQQCANPWTVTAKTTHQQHVTDRTDRMQPTQRPQPHHNNGNHALRCALGERYKCRGGDHATNDTKRPIPPTTPATRNHGWISTTDTSSSSTQRHSRTSP